MHVVYILYTRACTMHCERNFKINLETCYIYIRRTQCNTKHSYTRTSVYMYVDRLSPHVVRSGRVGSLVCAHPCGLRTLGGPSHYGSVFACTAATWAAAAAGQYTSHASCTLRSKEILNEKRHFFFVFNHFLIWSLLFFYRVALSISSCDYNAYVFERFHTQ